MALFPFYPAMADSPLGQPARISIRPSPMPGFTLLEMIVVLTILGLMAGMIFSSFRLALNSYLKGQERIEVQARQRILIDQIRRQVGSLFPLLPTAAFLKGKAGEVLQWEDGDLLMMSQSPLFLGTPEGMTFVTVVPLILEENPGLSVVSYGLSEDEWGKYYLGAMETRFTGLSSFVLMAGFPLGKPVSLIDSVASLRFEYYGYDSTQQIYEWFDSWNGEEMFSIPSAIRINYNDRHLTMEVNADFLGAFQGGLPHVTRQ